MHGARFSTAALLSAIGIAAACGGASSKLGFSGQLPDDAGALSDSGSSPPPGNFGDGSQATPPGMMPTGPVTDFPSPVYDGSAPPDSGSLFGPPTQGAATGGPCLVEPENDVLFPQNWLRPRFRWVAANGENLFELRLHVANQTQDLVVYTSQTSWTMPRPMWDALRTHSPAQPMTVSIRGGIQSGSSLTGEALGTQTPMGVAPVPATGAIVYWTTNDMATGTAVLKGFSPGDESVIPVLTPAQYAQGQQTTSTCIGCHTSTPDGEFAAFTSSAPANPGPASPWPAGVALIDPKAGTVGSAPPFLSSGGVQGLAQYDLGGVAFSRAHWATGDRRAVVSYDPNGAGNPISLAWIDLEATTPAAATGTIARNGDTQLAGAPAWSHNGQTIAYVSTNRLCTGRLGNCTPQFDAPMDPGSRADIFTVPYAGGAGGSATGLGGASDPAWQEYYPAFSPDDHFIAYNRSPNDANLHDQPAAELFVIPASGGTGTRLAANDPPACSGQTSPGVDNSWPKWGPDAPQANGYTYYWLTFSSKRSASTTQLYITSVVLKSDGSVENHGAIYLWNQPATENNHTPAWDTFKVPPVPPPQ
jgi:hypothetical protein